MTSGHWQLVNGIVTARDNWKLTISNTIDNHEHRQNGMCPTSRFLLHTSQISVRNNWHHSQVTQHTSGDRLTSSRSIQTFKNSNCAHAHALHHTTTNDRWLASLSHVCVPLHDRLSVCVCLFLVVSICECWNNLWCHQESQVMNATPTCQLCVPQWGTASSQLVIRISLMESTVKSTKSFFHAVDFEKSNQYFCYLNCKFIQIVW